VAIRTSWRGMFPDKNSIGVRDAMHARAIAQRLPGVAAGAINSPRRDVVVRMLLCQIIMATGAGVRLMNRSAQHVGIGKEGDGQASGIGCCQGFISMAFQAITIFDFSESQCVYPQHSCCQGRKQSNTHAASIGPLFASCSTSFGYYLANLGNHPGGPESWPLLIL